MADIIQIRRDTAANWATADPVLAQGEFGWEIDTGVLKLGDGSTAYTSLPSAFSAPPVDSVFGRTGAVVAVAGDYTATQITYSNATSGLSATNMQAAVDEVEARVDTLEAAPPPPVDSVFGRTGAVVAVAGDYTATQVSYSNATSGLTATNTQAAIDEVEARVDTLEAAPPPPVDSVFGRTGVVVAVAGDYTAAQVSYSNATSGLTATNTQSAIDEVEARVDTLEAAPPPPVDSVFGRTGAVVAVAGDYNATQVTYSNAVSGLTATNTQAAIDEIEGRVDVLESAPGAPVDSVFGRTGAVVAVAGDYTATQVTFDDSGVPVTAPNAQSAIEQLYSRVGVFEAFNTDTTTNLNTAGLTQVPIFGTTTQAGPAGYFTPAGNVLTVNVAMRVKVSANVSYESTSNRVNIAIGTSLNGGIQGATGRSGYIRNANGHNEASVHMSTIIDCAIGDQLGLFSQQQAAGGACTMIAARSNYIVEIVELL